MLKEREGLLLFSSVTVSKPGPNLSTYFEILKKTGSSPRRLQSQWLRIEMGFGLLYLAEMLAKIMAEGARHYWRTAANKFDCLVTLGIVVTQVTPSLPRAPSATPPCYIT